MTTDTMSETESAPVPLEEARPPRSDTWLVNFLAVVLALAIGGVLMALSDPTVRSEFGYFFQHPTDALRDSWYTMRDAYKYLFYGAIYNPSNDGTFDSIFSPIAQTLETAAPLICAGLGVALAFRAGLFNIGGQGQVIAGAMASGYVGFAWNLPPVLHLVVAIVAGIIGGAIWAGIAGVLKARSGAHEVITTIMLNYIALYGLAFLIQTHAVQDPHNPQISKSIHGNARLPHIFGSGLTVDLSIVLAIAAAAGLAWLLNRSRTGFRLRAVGANPAAARSAGMSPPRMTVLAFSLSGALVGLAGAMLVLGGSTQYVVTPQIDNGVGFDAITVALLGRSTPWGTVAAGLLLGALRSGAPTMQTQTSIPPDIVTVIQALIVIFVAAPRLTRAVFHLKNRGTGVGVTVTTNLAVTVTAVRTGKVPRRVVAGVTEIVLGVLSILVFGLSDRAKQDAIFTFSLSNETFRLGTWSVPARPVILVLSAVVVIVGVLRLTERLAARWCAAITIFCLLVSFTTWSIAGDPTGLNVVSLLQGALFPSAIPLILGALAGIIGERSGVVNVAIEGQLLLGAFAAAFLATIVGNVWVGVLAGALAGVLVAGLLSVLAIKYLVDQVIVGVVLNVFVLGFTNFLYSELMAPHSESYNQPGFLRVWKVPILGDIPLIGPVFFQGTLFLYFTYVAVVAVNFGLFHTRWGLRVRSVGEHPRAADTVGIKVNRTRYRAVLLAGVIAGLAGSMLVLGEGSAGTFSENMSSGAGFIALAAVIFGRWTPKGAVLAALLFGFAAQLANLLGQASPPINPNLLLTAPYIATLVAVAGFVGRVRPPAADGQPYTVG